jgi:demethylmenaquinone methyltransferase/2-methoxy-6-polyprenyl-1,4-benzoquinol methylase
MFDRLAGRYDLVNDLMSAGQHRWWRRRAVALAEPHGADVLDLATGTADLAIAAAEAGARRVIGVDFADGMLRVGMDKVRRAGWSDRISLIQADALALPIADAQFDVVTSGFLLRNLADLRAGLVEMRRVLRPGGRMVALEITHPPAGLHGAALAWYFRRVVPRLGGLFSGEWDAYRYLPASLDPLPSAEELAGMLTEVGFDDVKYRRLGLGTVAIHFGRA